MAEVINENGALSFRTKGDANNAEDRMAVPASFVWAGKGFGIAAERNALFGTVPPSQPPMPVRIGFVYGSDGKVIEFFMQDKER